jgi:hypothetical protein
MMMSKTGELPDVDVETLNAMIADIAHEMGRPHWAYGPDLVELGEIPIGIYGYNTGCTRSGVEMYREGQRWRRKALAQLQRRPEWVAKWLADREMDRRVEARCEAKGLSFAPFECPPWQVRVDQELPDPQDSVWYQRARLAQRLRRQLEAEIRAEDARMITEMRGNPRRPPRPPSSP